MFSGRGKAKIGREIGVELYRGTSARLLGRVGKGL